MKHSRILKFLFCLVLLCASAHAEYEIVIDTSADGGDPRFPIAVPRFLNQDGGSAGGVANKMLTVLRKDLEITGLFRVITDKQLPRDDKDTTVIDYKKWKAVGVGGLIKGITEKMGKETVIQLRVYDIAGEKMLVGKQYTLSAKNHLDATHRFVDTAMGYLTGFRGPFESKIIASCGKPFKRMLMVFEMDGSRMYKMTQGKGNNISPVWSPDGSRVVYTSFASNFPEVWITDGKSDRQITEFKSTTITPTWTPGGSSLVLASAMTGDTELYEVGLTGEIIRQITSTPNIDIAPTFSPDGQLAFSSERAGGLHMFLMNSDGTARRLTYVGFQNDQSDWSPDGAKIVFTGRDRGAYDVFVMEADGSNISRLTRGMGSNESPTWAPDSRYIVYSSTRGGLYTMLDDGRGQHMIPKSAGCLNSDWGPWLSPGDPGEYSDATAEAQSRQDAAGQVTEGSEGSTGSADGQTSPPSAPPPQPVEDPSDKTWENAWD